MEHKPARTDTLWDVNVIGYCRQSQMTAPSRCWPTTESHPQFHLRHRKCKIFLMHTLRTVKPPCCVSEHRSVEMACWHEGVLTEPVIVRCMFAILYWVIQTHSEWPISGFHPSGDCHNIRVAGREFLLTWSVMRHPKESSTRIVCTLSLTMGFFRLIKSI